MEILFQKYYHRLCHFAWQMIHDEQIAEDIVHDAFLTFWDNIDGIAQYEVVQKNFLYTTVKHACLNLIRHEKVVDRYQSFASNIQQDEVNILNKIIKSEVMEEIHRIISSMPTGCQRVFRMGYLEGLSNLEIAKELAISPNTVRTQKQRGLKILRENLNPEFYLILMSCQALF